MRFTTGAIIGFAAGYYLGAKAGRERYVEIERWLDRARSMDAYQEARERVTGRGYVGTTKAKARLDDVTGGASSDFLAAATGEGSPD